MEKSSPTLALPRHMDSFNFSAFVMFEENPNTRKEIHTFFDWILLTILSSQTPLVRRKVLFPKSPAITLCSVHTSPRVVGAKDGAPWSPPQGQCTCPPGAVSANAHSCLILWRIILHQEPSSLGGYHFPHSQPLEANY